MNSLIRLISCCKRHMLPAPPVLPVLLLRALDLLSLSPLPCGSAAPTQIVLAQKNSRINWHSCRRTRVSPHHRVIFVKCRFFFHLCDVPIHKMYARWIPRDCAENGDPHMHAQGNLSAGTGGTRDHFASTPPAEHGSIITNLIDTSIDPITSSTVLQAPPKAERRRGQSPRGFLLSSPASSCFFPST